MIYQNTYSCGPIMFDRGLLLHRMRSSYAGLLRDANVATLKGNKELSSRLKAHAGTLLDIMELFNITPKDF